MTRNYALGNQLVFDVLKRQISTQEETVKIGGREARARSHFVKKIELFRNAMI
ncbi:hypothetical protein Sbal183_0177 [Shewanella baltica OS183]|nr:hypothetical protein Sbal183_0177 [Shewanella baltica OS183]